MKRTTLVSLSAVLPIATLAIGTATAQSPKAESSRISTPAASVRQVARSVGYVITIVTRPEVASTGIKLTTAVEAAASLDG